MTHDTTIVDVVDPRSQPALPQAIAAREIHLDRILPAISVGALLLSALLCFVFLTASFFPLHHTDLWGHMALGRWAAEPATSPSPLPVDASITSTNTAWLSQTILFGWFDLTGIEGLQLSHALLATLAVGMLVLATRERGVSLGVALATGATAYLLMLPVIGVLRPQLFGLVAMPLVLYGVASLDSGKRHPLAWLPFVLLLWVNLHGSFAMGLMAVACLAVGRSWESSRSGYNMQQAIRRNGWAWLAVALSTAACCIHPAGPAVMWQAVSFGTSVNLASIVEWQPLTIKSLSGALFFFSLAVTAVLLRRSTRTIRTHEFLLLVLTAISTLFAIRMLVWWAIVWPWVVAPHVEAMFAGNNERPSRSSLATPIYTLTATVLLLLTLIWSPPSYAFITGQPRAATEVLSDETPTFLAEEVARRQLSGRALVPMQWADYLAFKSEGRLQPLVHSHVHLISPGIMHDYRRVMRGHPDWLKILDHHRVQYLVIRDLYSQSNADQLIAHPRLHIVYRDQQGAIFEIQPVTTDAGSGPHDVKHVEQPAAVSAVRVQTIEQPDEQANHLHDAHNHS